ncbi:hypothetical protein FA15DRAFT_696651 [Coprinopsis marcescibilis]|uniref:Uncharacterized protein n=1 Tax=Coprinopsis marcescibilis TaxID=230819 RepID=A0A5C3KLR7_COPMA|nr:hypothetical protein FA15DRAFT_696651 [Coprinopsis marcescibilis]
MDKKKARQPKDKQILAWTNSTEKVRKDLCDPFRAVSPGGKPIVNPVVSRPSPSDLLPTKVPASIQSSVPPAKESARPSRAAVAQTAPRSTPALANQGLVLTADAVTIYSGQFQSITVVRHDGNSIKITGSPSHTTNPPESGRLRRNNSQGAPRAVASRKESQSVGTATARPTTPSPKSKAPLDAAHAGKPFAPDTDDGFSRTVPIKGSRRMRSPHPGEFPASAPTRHAKPLVLSALPARLRLPQIDTNKANTLATAGKNKLPAVADDSSSICSVNLPVPRRWPPPTETESIHPARRPIGGVFTHTPTELDFRDPPQNSAEVSSDSSRPVTVMDYTYPNPVRKPAPAPCRPVTRIDYTPSEPVRTPAPVSRRPVTRIDYTPLDPVRTTAPVSRRPVTRIDYTSSDPVSAPVSESPRPVTRIDYTSSDPVRTPVPVSRRPVTRMDYTNSDPVPPGSSISRAELKRLRELMPLPSTPTQNDQAQPTQPLLNSRFSEWADESDEVVVERGIVNRLQSLARKLEKK